MGYEGTSSIHSFHKRTSDDSMSSTPRYKETVSPSPKRRTQKDFELEDLYPREKVKGGESGMKQPQNTRESSESFSEEVKARGETFTTEQEQSIILAALAVAQSGAKVTRDAVKVKLGWNNKQYDVLKAVCDKHNIGGN